MGTNRSISRRGMVRHVAAGTVPGQHGRGLFTTDLRQRPAECGRMGPNHRQRFYPEQSAGIDRDIVGKNRLQKRDGMARSILATAASQRSVDESRRIAREEKFQAPLAKRWETRGKPTRGRRAKRELSKESRNAQRSTSNVQRSMAEAEAIRPRGTLTRIQCSNHRDSRCASKHPSYHHISGQLLRCGASPYGNHGEVQAAESRRDFVHKLRVLRETEELIKIFFTSIRTADRN